MKADTLRPIRSVAPLPWPEAISGSNLLQRHLYCLNSFRVFPQLKWELVERFASAAGVGSLAAEQALARLY